MVPVLFTVSIITFVALFAFVGNHSAPTRRSGRERLLAANPWLNVVAWPDEIADDRRRSIDVRAQLTLVVVAALLYVGIAVDRRPVVDAPSWYDH